MGTARERGIGTEMDGQREPKPGNQLSFLRSPVVVVAAAIGAIVAANEVVSRAKRVIQGGTETARLLTDD